MEKMNETKRHHYPIPEHFENIEKAAEFWDTHDLGDYWDMTKEAHFETDIKRKIFLTALEPHLANRLSDYAHKQGVSTETIVNLWLGEKLAAVSPRE